MPRNVVRCRALAPVLNGSMVVMVIQVIMMLLIITGSTAASPKGRGSVVRPRHGAGTVANVYRCTQSEGEARQGTPRAPESVPCEYSSTRRSTH